MNGIIFDIKEFSIHDGPGARFTVFMKGCPLRCVWCHNPEGLSSKLQMMYKKNICTNCGMCFKECTHEECKSFSRCIYACPNGCLSVAGREISSKSLAEQLLKNADFFEMTGGGVTVSGGEPLMQSGFVCELADRLGNVHKAIQTSGYADFDTYKKTIDRFDYIMQDIKLCDREKHKKYTGVYNDTILKNIEYLKRSGKDFVFRLPIIPGITDTEENLKGISQIVEDYSLELLPYNKLAGAKYEMLDMNYKFTVVESYKKDLAKYFINAKIK